jgi:acyl-coenzyme A synthetase/AMP-(fatty) acid ligase
MHILDMVFHWARFDPHRPAVILPDMITTFGGIADAIDSISNRIDQLGLDQREPVAVSIANPALSLAVILALLRSGFSAAAANRGLIPHLQPNGIRNLIYDLEGLVASGGRNIRFDGSWLPSGSPPKRRYRRRPVGEVDLIFFTSGTSGLPKKIVQTRRGHEQRLALQRGIADAALKSALVAPGLASSFGFNRTCEILSAGKAACFAPSGDASLQVIGLFRVDTLIASTQQAVELATLKEAKPEFQADSLQTILIAGSKIGPEGLKRIRAALCRNIVISYGSTEAGTAAMAPVDAIEAVPDAVGFVTPWAEVEIVDDAGTALPDGREGIIRYRTPQFLGTARPVGATTDDQWFYPGDVGRLTEDGILCVSGRTSNIINIGGAKLSLARIEEILETVSGVREAAACGVEDAMGIERLWVAVVPSEPVTAEEIKKRLREHNDVGVAPDEVFLLDALPRGDLGKVQKGSLKDTLRAMKKIS